MTRSQMQRYKRKGRRVYRGSRSGRQTRPPVRRRTAMTVPSDPTPGVHRVTYVVAAICVALLALVFFAYSKQPDNSATTPGSSNAGSCEQDWQNHVAAANTYGYLPGDHDTFVNSCKDTIVALHDAVNSQNN